MLFSIVSHERQRYDSGNGGKNTCSIKLKLFHTETKKIEILKCESLLHETNSSKNDKKYISDLAVILHRNGPEPGRLIAQLWKITSISLGSAQFVFFVWSVILSCSTAAGGASVAKPLEVFFDVCYFLLFHTSSKPVIQVVFSWHENVHALHSNFLTQKPTRDCEREREVTPPTIYAVEWMDGNNGGHNQPMEMLSPLNSSLLNFLVGYQS